jgi:hypothetical protein
VLNVVLKEMRYGIAFSMPQVRKVRHGVTNAVSPAKSGDGYSEDLCGKQTEVKPVGRHRVFRIIMF